MRLRYGSVGADGGMWAGCSVQRAAGTRGGLGMGEDEAWWKALIEEDEVSDWYGFGIVAEGEEAEE